VKPTEILLDLNDLKLGRIVKKDFEVAVVDIHAAKMAIESPAPIKGAETLPVAPKFVESPVGPVAPKFEPKMDK
jgi:hypothetical protein